MAAGGSYHIVSHILIVPTPLEELNTQMGIIKKLVQRYGMKNVFLNIVF